MSVLSIGNFLFQICFFASDPQNLTFLSLLMLCVFNGFIFFMLVMHLFLSLVHNAF